MNSDRLPPPVRRMLLGITLSALGNGLVLPFAFVYLHSIRHISTSMAGLIFSYGAVISLLVAPMVGTLIDRWGPKPILMVSLVVSAIGYSSFSLIKTVPQAFLIMTICAIGQSAMWPSQVALNTELTPDHLRERIYGSQFALLNLGLGLGGMFASLIVSLEKPQTFETLYIGDGLSFLVYLAVVLSLRDTGRRTKEQREIHAKLEGGWIDVIRDRTFFKVWLVALFAIFSQLQPTRSWVYVIATTVAGVRPSRLAWAYAVNTAVIAIFQLWVIKKLEKLPRAKGLALAAGFWALAWAVLAIAGIAKEFAVPAIILCQFIFALGEMVWSPIMPADCQSIGTRPFARTLQLRCHQHMASWNDHGTSQCRVFLGSGQWALWIILLCGGLLTVAFFALRLKLPTRPTKEVA